MHWALRWVIGWLLFLWAIHDARRPPEPPKPLTCGNGRWDWLRPYLRSLDETRRPSVAVEPTRPRGLDLARLEQLFKQDARPPRVLRVARELSPNVYAVSVPDEWPGEVIRCGRIVPAFRNGRAYGFKLYGVRDEYVQLGLRNGDVVLQLNGIPLASPEYALGAYAALRDARRIELDLERDGRPIKKTYLLDTPLAERFRSGG